MLAPIYGVFDFLQQFQRLLPRGRVWQRGWGFLQAEYLITLMPTWVRLHERANDLLVDTFPCTTTELLPEWEASLGLPDPCTGPLDTIEARQAAVCAKFVARGGQSVAYFLHLADVAGIAVEIEEFAPFYTDRNRVGDRLWNKEGAYWWSVTFPPGTDPADAAALVCMFEAIKPAHTEIIWLYAGATPKDAKRSQ
jgi:uncharacterized protein YmfQ (DUF2313 family)